MRTDSAGHVTTPATPPAPDSTTEVLEEVTETILGQMRARRLERLDDPGRPEELREVARRAARELCAWDVNTGWCEAWAEEAAARTGGAAVWLDNSAHVFALTQDSVLASDVADCAHCVLHLRGRWYDSECPEGTADLRALTRRVTRDAYLARVGLR